VNELNDEVDDFLFLVLKKVIVTDEEREIVVFVDWAFSKNIKSVSSQCHKSLKHCSEKDIDSLTLSD